MTGAAKQTYVETAPEVIATMMALVAASATDSFAEIHMNSSIFQFPATDGATTDSLFSGWQTAIGKAKKLPGSDYV